MFVTAKRAVSLGEELAYHYGEEYFAVSGVPWLILEGYCLEAEPNAAAPVSASGTWFAPSVFSAPSGHLQSSSVDLDIHIPWPASECGIAWRLRALPSQKASSRSLNSNRGL